MDQPKIAVLLMAYGAAATLEEIPAYLADIRGGRATSPELVAEIRRRYEQIGGRSPLLDVTRAQASALEKILNRGSDSTPFKVFVGMRHSPPAIEEAVGDIARGSFSVVAAMPLTPYYSSLSIDAYRKKFDEAVRDQKASFETLFIDSWNDHPKFIRLWAQRVADAVARLPAGEPGDIEVIFSAHSLPQRILKNNDPYPVQLRRTAEAIARQADLRSWRFAYQSRGQTSEPWLGPDVADVLEQTALRKRRRVIVAPIGFVSDHMETLYDVDILYSRMAQAKGMTLTRVPSLNADPSFIEIIADVIEKRLTNPSKRGVPPRRP